MTRLSASVIYPGKSLTDLAHLWAAIVEGGGWGAAQVLTPVRRWIKKGSITDDWPGNGSRMNAVNEPNDGING